MGFILIVLAPCFTIKIFQSNGKTENSTGQVVIVCIYHAYQISMETIKWKGFELGHCMEPNLSSMVP